MRVPYAPSTPPSTSTPEVHSIYSRIAARRAPRPLIPLDLALLHNPSIADGWNSLLGAIRSKTSLDAGIVELAVCRVAVLNRAVYEWQAHAPLARKGGVGREGLETVKTRGVLVAAAAAAAAAAASGGEGEVGQGQMGRDGEGGLSAREWAVLQYTDAMTRNVEVDEEVFGRLKSVAGFSDEQCVEMTAVVAAYNCVSRFLVALDVGECNGGEMVVPE